MLRSCSRSGDKNSRQLALLALAAMGRKYAEGEIASSFECLPPSSLHFSSIKILEAWDDPKHDAILVAALRRFAPPEGIMGALARKFVPEEDEIERPRNGLLVAISRMLLARHTPSSLPSATACLLERVLRGDRKVCDAEAGFLLYLLSPTDGFAKIYANLSNRVPLAREEAAVFLTLIGTDETLNALIAIAQGSPDHGGHEAACALLLSDNPRAKEAAEKWARRNDGYEETEGREIDLNGRKLKTWSMDEMMRANMRTFVQGCSERVNRDYAPLLSKWRRQNGGCF